MISFQIIYLIGIDYVIPDIQEFFLRQPCDSLGTLDIFEWAEVPIANSVIIKDISLTRQSY